MKRDITLMLLMVITAISGCMTGPILYPVETKSAAPIPEPVEDSGRAFYEQRPRLNGGIATVSVLASDTSANDAIRYRTVRTFFGTSRNRDRRRGTVDAFGDQPAEISYGICNVTIPKSHRVGGMERPSILRLEFKEDPNKHMTVKDVEVLDRESFYMQISSTIKESPRQSALIFVHGYNVTFENAARRTAQIAQDLEFEGAPVFYSWPSAGNVMAYSRDAQVSVITRPELKVFLTDFLGRSEAENIFIIAHSMGAWAITPVLAEIFKERPAARERIKEVILAAADIDADVFKRQIAPAFVAAGEPITLYSSSNDYALIASKVFNGFPRLGDSGKGLVIMPGMETIDASEVPTDFLGHSYIGDTRSLISDIYYIIGERLRADKRAGLRRIDGVIEGAPYWVFKK